MLAFQGSLLSEPTPHVTDASIARRHLDRGAWVDHAPEWLAGADSLFVDLTNEVSWRNRTRRMYDRDLLEPRLTGSLTGDAFTGHSVVQEIVAALGDRYGATFGSCWMNLYRDGRDSVAWHGDRVLRERDTGLVAIVSIGERRPFLLRPKGGGRSIRYALGRGDLLVMGGTCQRTWDHSVPKVAVAGPRLSLTFRPEEPA